MLPGCAGWEWTTPRRPIILGRVSLEMRPGRWAAPRPAVAPRNERGPAIATTFALGPKPVQADLRSFLPVLRPGPGPWRGLGRLAVLAPLALVTLGVGPAFQQRTSVHAAGPRADADWSSEQTGDARYTVRFTPATAWARDQALLRLPPEHDALAAVLGGRLPGPLTLHLHESSDELSSLQPAYVSVDGAIARIARPSRDLHVVVGRRADDPDLPIARFDAALRLELAELFVVRLAGGRLPAHLQSGITRYLALPPDVAGADSIARGVAHLREAHGRATVPGWEALAAPSATFEDPRLVHAAGVSIAHFLVERDGLGQLIRLIDTAAGGAGWRTALERTYGGSAASLEAAWRRSLGAYLDGAWRDHPLFSDPMGRAERLLRTGRADEALVTLGASLSFLDAADPAAASRARAAIDAAEKRLAAADSLSAAVRELDDGDYAGAAREARAVLEAVADPLDRDDATVAAALEVEDRAALGMSGEASLARAREAGWWRALAARREAVAAYGAFALLGNGLRAAEAASAVGAADRVARPIGWLLLAVGGMVLARAELRLRRLHSRESLD